MTFHDEHLGLYKIRYAISIRIRGTLHNGCVEKTCGVTVPSDA